MRQGSFYIYIVHIYIRALLPYDCRSCNGCHHQYVFTNIVFIIFFIFDRGKYKHIVLIIKANLSLGVIIAIVLLLYWLFIAEDLNAWLNVN